MTFFKREGMQRFETRWEMLRGRSIRGGVVSQEGAFHIWRFLHHKRRAASSVVFRTKFSIHKCIRREPDPMDCLMSLDRREDNYFLFLQRAAVDLYWGFPGSTHVGDAVLHCTEALCLQPFETGSLFCPGWLQWQVKGGLNTL